MPTLTRLIFIIAVIVGSIYAAMFALTVLVEPAPRQISVDVPPDLLKPQSQKVKP
ncbi:histidine kinase [Rhizobium sp. PAMB 3182]